VITGIEEGMTGVALKVLKEESSSAVKPWLTEETIGVP